MISTYTREYVYNHLTYVVIPDLDTGLADILQEERDRYKRNLEWYAESWAHRFLVTAPTLNLEQMKKEFNAYRQKIVDMAEKMLRGHQSYVSFDETEVWMYKLDSNAVVAIGD
jgi:hypothetical protein